MEEEAKVAVVEEVAVVAVNVLCSILLSTTWNVSPNGTGNQSLVHALSKARSGDTILAGPGIYFPGTKRSDSFTMKKGVTLQGAGDSSVLSGEIGEEGAEDNCYHVVIGAQDAKLIGFTVTGGNANKQVVAATEDALQKAKEWPTKQARGRNRKTNPESQVDAKGGGMRNDGIKMAIENCLFENNNAIYGGAMYNTNEADVMIIRCKFVRNSAKEGGGIYNYNLSSPTITDCDVNSNSASRGGGIMNRYASSPTITNSQFVTNEALVHGGALCNDYGASPQITACEFQQNFSGGDGGAMFTDDTASQFGKTAPLIRECQFESNESIQHGGAIANYNKCSPTIEFCDFNGNRATSGGAICSWRGATAHITQCDFGTQDSVVNRP